MDVIQYNLDIKDTFGTQPSGLCTVEPGYKGHYQYEAGDGCTGDKLLKGTQYKAAINTRRHGIHIDRDRPV